MISERTLRNWRRGALKGKDTLELVEMIKYVDTSNERILRLTQDLLDLHLIRKG